MFEEQTTMKAPARLGADRQGVGERCSHCGRDLFRKPDGALDLIDPVYPNSTMCDIRNNGFEEGLPHVEKTQWMLDGLNGQVPELIADGDAWRDLIYGLLTTEERVELMLSDAGPEFTHDGVTYARDSDGVWRVKSLR